MHFIFINAYLKLVDLAFMFPEFSELRCHCTCVMSNLGSIWDKRIHRSRDELGGGALAKSECDIRKCCSLFKTVFQHHMVSSFGEPVRRSLDSCGRYITHSCFPPLSLQPSYFRLSKWFQQAGDDCGPLLFSQSTPSSTHAFEQPDCCTTHQKCFTLCRCISRCNTKRTA